MARVWAVSCGSANEWPYLWPIWRKEEYVAIGYGDNDFPLIDNNGNRLTNEVITLNLIERHDDSRLRNEELVNKIREFYRNELVYNDTVNDDNANELINGFIATTELSIEGEIQNKINEINNIIRKVNTIYSSVGFLERFAFGVLENDYVVVKNGNRGVLGLAQIIGGIRYAKEPLTTVNDWHQFRKVRWIKTFDDLRVIEIAPYFTISAFHGLGVECNERDITDITGNDDDDKKRRMETILETFGLLEASRSDKKKETNMPPNPPISPLNQILYGPPGTGKTYNTVSEALKIFNIKNDDYSILKKQFDDLKSLICIDFVTFHQSFSYEDFVEGIRAETNDKGELSYSIKDGIFKKIAIEALFSKFEELFNDQLPEKWQEAKAVLSKQKTTDINTETAFDPTKYNHKKLILSACTLADFKNAKGKGKPYVLIIDEINRGNTSRVFGELITLIETTKRAGTDEAMDAILPYSQETFTVPDNLYIIGTMNTADRSLALMDTALRRRFDFIEMMPKPELIVNDSNNPLEIEGIKVQEMLQTINDRIEALYDREHTIGHAFFMKLKDEPTIETLASIFRNNILPLLEEYFFEDWDKIINVLGKTEIYKENPNLTETKLGFKPSNKSYSRNANALTKPETYISIYDSVSNNNSVQSE